MKGVPGQTKTGPSQANPMNQGKQENMRKALPRCYDPAMFLVAIPIRAIRQVLGETWEGEQVEKLLAEADILKARAAPLSRASPEGREEFAAPGSTRKNSVPSHPVPELFSLLVVSRDFEDPRTAQETMARKPGLNGRIVRLRGHGSDHLPTGSPTRWQKKAPLFFCLARCSLGAWKANGKFRLWIGFPRLQAIHGHGWCSKPQPTRVGVGEFLGKTSRHWAALWLHPQGYSMYLCIDKPFEKGFLHVTF